MSVNQLLASQSKSEASVELAVGRVEGTLVALALTQHGGTSEASVGASTKYRMLFKNCFRCCHDAEFLD